MDYSRLGCYAEHLFAIKCMELGYDISMPLRHASTYDAILDTGKDLLKIQIKSSFLPPDPIRKSVKVKVTQGTKNATPYKVNEIDYLAIYTDYFKGFFIFEYTEIRSAYRLNPEGIYKKNFDNFAFNL